MEHISNGSLKRPPRPFVYSPNTKRNITQKQTSSTPVIDQQKTTERETEDQHAKTYHSVEESNHTPSVNETRKKVTRMNPESSDASERRTSCGRIVREPKRFIEEMY